MRAAVSDALDDALQSSLGAGLVGWLDFLFHFYCFLGFCGFFPGFLWFS